MEGEIKMKLRDLRQKGSQSIDEFAEFILTPRSLIIYETNGNGIYYLARSYKIVGSKFETAFIDLAVNDAERLVRV
jgi:hypothetical protein